MPVFRASPRDGDHELFRNIVRLVVLFSNPATGDQLTLRGTAFTLRLDSTTWLITNRHCIDIFFPGTQLSGLVLTEIKAIFPGPRGGPSESQFTCNLDTTLFRMCDSTDLAAFQLSDFQPVDGGAGYRSANLTETIISGDSLFDNIRVGSEVHFIGYPGKLWDTRNSLPILRTASISSIPSYNYGIADQSDEPRVLVSGLSLGGGSGSPVFFQTSDQYMLVGVMSGHYAGERGNWNSEFIMDNTSNQISIHTGLSYFIKAPTLRTIPTWPKYDRHCNRQNEQQ